MKAISLFLFSFTLILLGFKFFEKKVEEPEKVLKISKVTQPAAPKALKEKPITKKEVTKNAPPQKKQIPRPPKIRLPRYPQAKGENFALFDFDGNLVIQEVLQDGDNLIIQGDILIGSHEDFIRNERDRQSLRLKRPALWPKSTIPYLVEAGLPNKEFIDRAVKTINKLTNVYFRPKKVDEKDYVFFKSGKNNCYSNLGKIGGTQYISLSPRCAEREILHEMMHTLGYIHEQNREDRDEYLEVQWHNIEDHFHSQFKKMPNHFLRVEETPFDFQSIMLYHPKAFSKDTESYSMTKVGGDIYPPPPGTLSNWDVERVNENYPPALEKDE